MFLLIVAMYTHVLSIVVIYVWMCMWTYLFVEDEEPPAKPKKSVILDKYNFEEETENDIVFVKFCSPTSAQCKKLEPIWEELATAYFEVKVVKIAEVNCRAPDDINKKLCKKHGVI